MRASETVSEANPGSTASQTGVPTQVVQQVQGTQQVGHTPSPGWVGRAHEGTVRAVTVGTWPPHPTARAICSPALIKMFTSAALPPTRLGLLGKPAWLRAFLLAPQRLLVQTSVQAKPGHVSPLQLTSLPVPQQVRLPHWASALTTSPGCRTNPL